MANYIIPCFLFILFVYCYIKKINAYNHFVCGAKESIDLCINTFPYLVAIFMAVELFKLSGLAAILSGFLSPALQFVGMPSELAEFMILRPFTGSGSLAMLSEIIASYGVDNYITKCACVIMSCSETIFYVSAVYFSQTSVKKLFYAIPLALGLSLFGTTVACFLCRFI